MTDRFDQDGVKEDAKVETALLSRCNTSELNQLLKDSPWSAEIFAADLAPQLQVLFKYGQPESLDEAVALVTDHHQGVRAMFPDVVRLVRLLLTLPASSTTAERNSVLFGG